MKLKNIFFAALALTACASCTTEDEPQNIQGNLILRASLETFNSRAAIENGKITWSEGDNIAALLSDNSFATLTLQASSVGQATGDFVGELTEGQTLATEGFYAYYPAAIAVSANEVQLPSSYDLGKDFTNTHAIMKGTGKENILFKHLGGVLTFNLCNVPATSTKVRFTTLDNQNIVGNFTLKTDASGYEYVETTTGAESNPNSSVVACFTELTKNSDIQVSFPLPVGTYEGIKLEVLDNTDNLTATTIVAAGASNTITRASRVNMPKITLGATLTDGSEYSTWDGTSEEPAYDSSTNTYEISNAAQLKGLADLVADGNSLEGQNIVLNCNVNLNGKPWAPIAPGSRNNNSYSATTAFKGTFDGNGNTISGLTINEGTKDQALGFFGIIDGGQVSNINFVDVNINASANENAGAVTGLLLNGGKVSNVTVYGSVSTKRGNGGIVGRLIIDGTIENCENHATITGTGTNVGGIVGAAYYTAEGKTMTIKDCTNFGTVTAPGYVGGIAGLSSANISGCTNNGEVTGNGSTNVGGIVGEQSNAGSVKNCINTAVISQKSDKYGTGGIIGWVRYAGSISDYPFKEVIEVSGNTNKANIFGGIDAGGIVGVVYSYGNIHDNNNYAQELKASTFVAGIVGSVQNDSHPGIGTDEDWHVYVKNNYSTTSLAQMTGSCKALYVYINTPEHTTAEGNSGAE